MQAEDVFHATVELPVEVREAFLTEQCGGDATLHARVLRLLAAHDASACFMVTAVLSPENRERFVPTKSEAAGECIGPYRLIAQIGEGGFGVVWLAEQDRPVKRQVALKIIRMGMDTEEVIARFGQERQALAVMDHPNIAKVFDAGATPTGRPYFAMELVRGVKITEYCDENVLSTEQRLELFVQVCHAVQHAHQKGIIHRDLKPSNILVETHDGQPVPKVIDFGVAKATGVERLAEVTLRTRMEQLVGTPLYMSPEQASLAGSDIDTRSDIYSLGVLLYEMLTGRPPFDAKTLMAAGFEEMQHIIREVEPPRPSMRLIALAEEELRKTARLHASEPRKLTSVLRGDLDWIVMKAIEKDRTRRYESANGLAMDIQRHLHSEPVLARPPSTTYRLRRWAKRNKLAFAAGSSIVAVLLVGIALTTWQAVRATRAEREQARLRKSAETEVARSKQVSLFLQSTLAALDPNIAAGRDTTLLRVILDSAGKRVGAELKDQPDVEADLRTTIGDAYVSIGEPEKGEQMHREALRLRQMLHGPEHLEVSLSLQRLGFALANRGRHVEAEASMRAALAMRRKLLPTADVQTARILAEMVWSLQSNGKHAEAVTMAREALEIRTRVFGEKDNRMPNSLGTLGSALWSSGDLPGAEVETAKACDLFREYGNGESVNMAQTLTVLGKIQLERGKAAEAETALREAGAIMTTLVGRESVRVADILTPLSQSLVAQGKLEEAEKLARETVAIRQAKQEPAHPSQHWALRVLVGILRERADYAGAEPVARQMVDWMRQQYGPDHAKVADAIMSLAELLRSAGKTNEADQEIAKAMVIRKSYTDTPRPPGSPESQELWMAGERAARKGDWVEAARVLTLAAAEDIEVLGDLNSRMKLGGALIASGDIDGYRKLCHSLSEAVANARDPILVICLARAGLLLPETGFALDEGSRLADLSVAKSTGWPSAPWYLATQALSEYRCGRFENAAKIASERLADPRCPVNCRPLASPVVAMAQYRAGRIESARTALQAAEKDLKKGWFDDTRKDLGKSWHDWVIGHILLREARKLIEGIDEPPPVAVGEAQRSWNAGVQAGRKGQWAVAAGAMSGAIAEDRRLLGNHYTHVMMIAAALVEANDIDGYRRLCASLSEVVASTSDRNTAVSLARTGLLLPNTGIPLGECSRLAALVLQSDPGKSNWPWSLALSAMSEYRCGRFEDAVAAAEASLADPRCHVACRPLAAPVLAMAHFRAGRIEIARSALQAAEKELSKGWFNDSRQDLGTSWHDWLIGHILLREARGLIEGTALAAPQAR